MLPDEKLVNTIKLIALKNALDFDNNIKLNVVISKTFSFLKTTDKNSIKGIVPEINKIVSELSQLPLDAKKIIYDSIFNTSDHHLNNDVSQESEIQFESKGNKEKILSKDFSFDDDSCSLPPLNNASYGNVITRFPPEPNGYPHIGHAKAAIIDEEYAKRYGGKLILRFDDTNPTKEKLDYYYAI
ncbi:MAG TPA: glutamate--tRNA ligase family protein, partial [Candidatus Nitrosocosmicus sp.]|nr:glutamate--tRNA ligase family protein [Candidatus Nitrosocosmicus sp.]